MDAQRAPLYRDVADLEVDVTTRPPDAVADVILAALDGPA
jgi:hypothetical protein